MTVSTISFELLILSQPNWFMDFFIFLFISQSVVLWRGKMITVFKVKVMTKLILSVNVSPDGVNHQTWYGDASP